MKPRGRYGIFRTELAPYSALIATSPRGLIALALQDGTDARTIELATHFRLRRDSSSADLLRIAGALDQYLASVRPFRPRIPVHPWWAYGLDMRVYRTVQKTVPGETMTYGEIARRIGGGGLARRVGLALARNWTLIAIPCHRVISANGSLGGFGGGAELKLRLLRIEKRFTESAVRRAPYRSAGMRP